MLKEIIIVLGAAVYFCIGVFVAWALCMAFNPKDDTEAEAAASLAVFAALFWPFILAVLTVFGIAHYFEDRKKRKNDEEV